MRVHDDHVLGANRGNPHGHFEDEEFLDFQAGVTTRYDANSHGWEICPAGFLAFSPDEQERARTLVSVRAAKYPRSVLFLPEWKGIVPGLKTLLLWRPCAQVVRSLLKRSKDARHPHLHASPRQARALWRAYNERVCAWKELYPDETVLLPLPAILRGDRRAFEVLNTQLQLGLADAPLQEVYDPHILRGERASQLGHELDSLRGDREMELRLSELSDLPPDFEDDSQLANSPDGEGETL